MNPIHALIRRYDVPTPRYTSYPTVPFWEENTFSVENWKQQVQETFGKNPEKGLSLYIHLPFCEKLCTYCGCNKRITTNHKVETPYLESILAEWRLYGQMIGQNPKIQEIHLGGGTPTFFSAKNLEKMLKGILQTANLGEHAELSFEAHPNSTTEEHLKTLYDIGFRCLSVGIQDFDPKVQDIINRPQTFEQTQKVFEAARKGGYTSINADIIYGLPFQTADSIALTIRHIQELKPERIAFYSYAHVPWKSPAQRRYTEADLPHAEEKRRLYEIGREMLEKAGYQEIGMDHFALPHDPLYKALLNQTLHRNFMGYTTQTTDLLIGLGASSIGDTGVGFAQNLKEVEAYQECVERGELPVCKGHRLHHEDQILRQHILNLMCKGETSWEKTEFFTNFLTESLVRLQPLAEDGLVELGKKAVKITDLGKMFLRNIAMQFDARYWEKQRSIGEKTAEKPLFSKAI